MVTHGQNGFIFENHKDLADQLKFWFENFPSNPNILESKERFRKILHEFQALRWHENWRNNALPIFNSYT